MNQPQQNHQGIKTPTKNTVNGVCFRCNKEGHWARDCPLSPNKNTNRAPISHPSSTPIYPAHHCRCGAGLCEIRVSHSQNNPGRMYYCCPAKFEMYCKYFKWCDQLKSDEIIEVRPKQFPVCGKCGAGVCVVEIEHNMPNVGRKYFACPIKQGDGRCSYKQWVDVYVGESSMEEDQEMLSYEAELQIQAVEMKYPTEPSPKEARVQMVNIVDPEVQLDPVRGASSYGTNITGKHDRLLKMGEYELEKVKSSAFMSPVEHRSSGDALRNHASSSSLLSGPALIWDERGLPPGPKKNKVQQSIIQFLKKKKS